jgi:hypothetical protein
MFNTEMGESSTATMLVECVQLFQRDGEYAQQAGRQIQA